MKEVGVESDEERNTGHMNEEQFYHIIRRAAFPTNRSLCLATKQHLQHGHRIIFHTLLAIGLKVTKHVLEVF
jgi:hypothetical protein